jgi:hypothetical protein
LGLVWDGMGRIGLDMTNYFLFEFGGIWIHIYIYIEVYISTSIFLCMRTRSLDLGGGG